MKWHLSVFRPGEAARNYPRIQFGLNQDGRCGAMITHHIPGIAWRHAITKNYESRWTEQESKEILIQVREFSKLYHQECLHDNLYSDSTEKANSITRDKLTNTLCLSVGLYVDEVNELYFSVKESSFPLHESSFYQRITAEITSYDENCSLTNR